MAFRSNGGHIAGEEISAYVDEELSPAETSRVYAHLQACVDCRALADDMRATQTLVRNLPLVRAPRDFTLGPEFDVAPARQASYGAPKRWFNFMPAIAMSAAILVLLVFVDVSSIGTGGDSSGGLGATSSAGRAVEDAAKSSAQESANAPQPPPLAPRQTQPAPGTGGSGNQPTSAPTRVPQAAAGAPAPGTPVPLIAPAAAPPATGSTPPAVIGGAQVPTPTGYAVVVAADETGGGEDDGGITLLRVLEVIAAVVLVGSLGGLYWQKRRV